MVPPLPKEASVIRHLSVRGLKRQSDERKRDRESGQYVANGDCKVSGRVPGGHVSVWVFSLTPSWFQTDLRSYLSEPELPGTSAGSDVDYQYLQSRGM